MKPYIFVFVRIFNCLINTFLPYEIFLNNLLFYFHEPESYKLDRMLPGFINLMQIVIKNMYKKPLISNISGFFIYLLLNK